MDIKIKILIPLIALFFLFIVLIVCVFAANTMDEHYSFTIMEDTLKPYIIYRYPNPGERNIPLRSDIIIKLKDDESGIDVSTIKMRVNNKDVEPRIEYEENGEVIVVRYSTPVPYKYNEVIYVDIFAQDNAD